MIDPLKSKDIVMSVQTCYATDSPQFSKMDVYHYLISSMCADPRDETIQAVVIKNLVNPQAVRIGNFQWCKVFIANL